MRSPTSSEDSRSVRIVVPCAQTRLPGPRAHRDAFSSSSERRGASAACFDRPARQTTEPRAKGEAMSALCYGLMVDSTFKRSENVTITW